MSKQQVMNKEQVKLPNAVAAEFELHQWQGSHKQYFGRFGTIDLNKITLDQAERLVSMGFNRIRKKSEKKATKAVKLAPKQT